MDEEIPTPFMVPFSFGKVQKERIKEGLDAQEEDEQDEEPEEYILEEAPLISQVTEVLEPQTESLEARVETALESTSTFSLLDRIYRSIKACTYDYFHSAVLSEYKDPSTNVTVSFGLMDIILIGAITGADLLMTGNTGCGKTMIANRMAIALLGHKHYTEKTCTPGTREADFTDLNFDTLQKGGKLREAIERPPVLRNPCVVINELNRMPEMTQNKLIPFFDYKYDYLGAHFDVGVETSEGLYQFRIVTINEGDQFGGVSSIDAAIRDRMPIEIPMDLFPLSREDRYKKRKSHARALETIKNGGHQDDIFSLLSFLKTVQLSPEAEMFLAYLEGLNNCVKSNTRSKMGVDLGYVCQNLCSGCHNIQYDDHICNNVLAPSERAQDKLRDISQGYALLRAYHASHVGAPGVRKKLKDANIESIPQLRVEVEDVIAAAPFVLFSKININPLWIQKHYQGNKWAAVVSVVKTAYQRYQKFLDFDRGLAEKYFTNQSLTAQDKKRLEDYAVKKDAWAYRVGVV